MEKSQMNGIRAKFLSLSVLALMAAGCSDNDSPEVSRLPISLNEVMVALVNQAADPLWAATWNNPQSDRDWRELERLAYQVQLGGVMLSIPGTGPYDDEWTADSRWQELSQQLARDGAAAVRVVRNRDLDSMGLVGSDLVDTCEACHRIFKPDLPTMGQFGELSPLPPVSY
jgi:hypothetical protein